MLDTSQSLLDYDFEMLQAIALTRGLDTQAGRAELLAAVSEANSRPLSVRLLWDELTQDEQRALAHLVAKGGWMPAVYFEHEFGAVRPFGPARLQRERLWEAPQSVTESLFFRGVIFRGFSPGREAAVWYVPTDLAPLLPVGEVESGDVASEPQPLPQDVPPTRLADDYLVRALYHVVAAARLGERPLASAVLARLASEPGAPDEVRVEYFAALARALANEAGFLRGETIARSAVEDVRQWLAAPRPAALRSVARLWLSSTSWHELLHAPGLVFEGGQLPTAAPARQAVADALRRLSPGQWYSVADFQAWMRSAAPDFLRRDSDFDSLYLRDGPGGEPLDGISAWMRVEGRFIEETLAVLNALHCVSLGAIGATRCFRVEPTAWWEPETAPRAPKAPLTIGPGLTLRLAPGASLLIRYQIECFADRGETPGTYRITRSSLRRAQARGTDPGRVERFLQAHSGGLVASARQALQALSGPVVAQAESAVVLTPEDEDALEVLRQDPGIGLCLESELPGGKLLFRRERWPAASARLKALGFVVKGEET